VLPGPAKAELANRSMSRVKAMTKRDMFCTSTDSSELLKYYRLRLFTWVEGEPKKL